MEKITFCINTSINERSHIELLFRSLNKNLAHKDHDIIVYIENDNQRTTEFLLTQKEHFPNLKIVKNPLPVPLDYSRNINLMFEMAKTDIVSYLQSDMVICRGYDEEVVKQLTPDTIISSTRIEPPLHPPSSEKITYDFGVDPKTFNLDEFSIFADSQKRLTTTAYFFAPFTLYKKNWVDIGGHDILFRRSRVDSDIAYRFAMQGLKLKQAWNVLVYHFTCTSSRGPEWWTEKSKPRIQIQNQADVIEMGRFLRKWPQFKHPTTFDPLTEYKYHVSANFRNVTPHNAQSILQNYYRFNHIYIDNELVRESLRSEYDNFHTYANILLNFTPEQWKQYKKYLRTWEFDDIFVSTPIINDDVIIDVDPQTMDVFTNPIVVQINDIVHQSDIGQYECGTGVLTINRVVNRITENITVKNPSTDDIQFLLL